MLLMRNLHTDQWLALCREERKGWYGGTLELHGCWCSRRRRKGEICTNETWTVRIIPGVQTSNSSAKAGRAACKLRNGWDCRFGHASEIPLEQCQGISSLLRRSAFLLLPGLPGRGTRRGEADHRRKRLKDFVIAWDFLCLSP